MEKEEKKGKENAFRIRFSIFGELWDKQLNYYGLIIQNLWCFTPRILKNYQDTLINSKKLRFVLDFGSSVFLCQILTDLRLLRYLRQWYQTYITIELLLLKICDPTRVNEALGGILILVMDKNVPIGQYLLKL